MNPASALALLASAIEAIAEILDYAKQRRESAGLDTAADALTAVRAVIDAVRGGKLEEADLARAADELQVLRRALAGNDAAADQAVRDKFGGGGQK